MEVKENNVVESEFLTKKMTSLFWKYCLYSLGGIGFQAVACIGNGIFVGNGIGPLGLASISVIAPFWLISVGLWGMFGLGGSSLAAIKLGNGDVEGAKKVYASTMIFVFLFCVIVDAIVLLNLDAVLTFMGATPEILPMIRSYVFPWLFGHPFCIVASVATFFAFVAERPRAVSFALNIPAIVSIALEYYFIFVMKTGLVGSAITWVIAVGCAIILVPYLQLTNSVFKLNASHLKINFSLVLESCKIGFVLFILQVAAIVSTIMINNLIISNGGTELDLASYAILNAYVAYILIVLTQCFTSAIQPIASYNLGAGKYSRMADVIKIGMVQGSLIVLAILTFEFLMSDHIIGFFAGGFVPLVEATKATMMIMLPLFAFGNLAAIVSGYFAATKNIKLATLNGVTKSFVFLVPLLLILPNFFGLKGVWLAMPGSDLLAFIVALICVVREYKKLRSMQNMESNLTI
ncbi:MATE family efflux transporter [Sinanaerobacter chloroacetimidivorans]|uniref:Uncharacterized protein n=1 Tax=Sinanaerobacter chloroacetimidivorans TaxID=2818044 RepID=A0A8J7VYA4_9FIRM|nr:MATE family efflux transporter [Sinanaerobacter chloroacetimidivorans]MBR0597312.1 hypothetical protein [Sinanaerobacter chloroacetimidivorans]